LLDISKLNNNLIQNTHDDFNDLPTINFTQFYTLKSSGKQIIDVSVCKRFGRILTLSDDNTIRIKGRFLQNVEYKLRIKPIKAVIHPWGYQVIVIYSTHLELYTILINSLLLIKEMLFEIGVKLCDLSSDGNLIAITDSENLNI
jgi:hypothetical protein